ncbi:uncharacterized protein [Rutidosis leptorrhynchoides]|uniref:uncharacterized protein n=1 Tax=Rutidosis leptorrhynchoides TaxID=125765 RepID=UPI003A99C865
MRLNIDTSSNVNVMYEHCFRQLHAAIKSKMRGPTTIILGFFDESVWPLGCIKLELELVDDDDLTHTRSVPVELCVVRSYSFYNALLGQVTLQKFGTVLSTVRDKIKFPTTQGIATIQTKSIRALCASVTPPKLFPTIDEQVRSSSILVNLKRHDWVPRSIAEHKLNANPNLTPVCQKKPTMEPERSEWLRLEMDMLVHVNILREIQMAEADEDKTEFHTDQGIYCYTKMPFGLKITGATYQRVMDVAFKDQICRNIEAYVDDLVIKRNTEVQMLADILETFNSL